jgi:hypothetical protein
MSAHVHRNAVSVGGREYPVGDPPSYNGSGDISIQETIAVGTDTLVNIAVDVSAVKLCFIWSDRAITIETNATDASGGNTLTLVANVPYVWTTDSYNTFKLTADVTKMYVTNASGGSAQLVVKITQDATP